MPIAASATILSILTQEGYYGPRGKIAKLHSAFVKGLTGLAQNYPNWVERPYGIGSMVAFTPFKGDRDIVLGFLHALYEAGLLCFITGGTPTHTVSTPCRWIIATRRSRHHLPY